VPVPSRDKLGGLQQEGHPALKWDDGGGPMISLDGMAPSRIGLHGVAPSQIVGVSASVIFPCTINSRRFLLPAAHLGSPEKGP